MLDLPRTEDLSLYLHIPFCTTCCNYCAFYSEPLAACRPNVDRYVDRLESEIVACMQDRAGFRTIFIGGGNPGTLSCNQLERLLRSANAPNSREVTIEMNPETFNESFFPLFSQGLVTRLSIGIQSMDDGVLGTLGRNARRKDNLKGLQLAQKARDSFGIDLSFDLMLCLPGQTIEQAIDDIHQVLSYADCNHISLYCLTVEEGTELARQVGSGQTKVLDEDGQQQFLQNIWSELATLGFEHYEVSNFCKNGKKCLHNMVYWGLGNYIGLGSSAASTLKDHTGYRHLSQTQNLSEFSTSTLFSGYTEERLGLSDEIEEFIMMSLRTDKGILKLEFAKRFSLDFDMLFAHAVRTLHRAWYTDDKYGFVVTEAGYMVLDEIVLRMALEIPQALDRIKSL